MYTDVGVHPQAVDPRCTPARFRFQRPSMGAWTFYGLGSENSELPGFITINPAGGARATAARFCQPRTRASRSTACRSTTAAAAWPISTTPGFRPNSSGEQLDLLATLNKDRLQKDGVNTDLEGLIQSYELAFRMEGAVPAIMDISNESQEHARRLRHRHERHRQLWPAVPAGAAFRRSGRAIYRAGHGGLGPAQQLESEADRLTPGRSTSRSRRCWPI